MSFYTDQDFFLQDDHHDASQQEQENEANELFMCVNCGGTESYLDGTSGLLCCSLCFTQSQTQTQPEEDGLDIDEIHGLAARTRGGQFKSAKVKSKAKGKSQKQPLSELDKSVALPNLETCLKGMQQVLLGGIRCVCNILALQQKESQQVQDIVFQLWRIYLTSWTRGAEYYGALHPQVRFSLRDAFVTKQIKKLLLRHLSHTSMEKATLADKSIKQESEMTSDDDAAFYSEDNTGLVKDSETSHDDTSSNEKDTSKSTATKVQPTSFKYQRDYSKIQSVLRLHKKKGSKEAALSLQPTMTFCTALLWIATSPLGVSAHHLVSWIANGSLPFLNAHYVLLTEQQQVDLTAVKTTFQMSQPPTVRLVEYYANLLMVACGWKNKSNGQEQELVVGAREPPPAKQKPNYLPCPGFLSNDSIPLMAARFVTDLGLGQDVLDVCLALMGIVQETRKDGWLPAPLPSAHPCKLQCPAHVLGVIVVACKMSWNWHGWSISRPLATNQNADSAKRAGRRFVPWNEAQFRLLGNGPLLEQYMDFLEETYLDHQDTLPEYKTVLNDVFACNDTMDNMDDSSKSETKQEALVVSPNPILVGAPNPNRGKRTEYHKLHISTRKRKATWNDINGIGNYVIYDEEHSSKQTGASSTDKSTKNKRDSKSNYALTLTRARPFHSHYSLLLEHMSYKTCVEPSEIHDAVSRLDRELLESIQNRPPPRRNKRRRRKQPNNQKKKRLVRPTETASDRKETSNDDNDNSNEIKLPLNQTEETDEMVETSNEDHDSSNEIKPYPV